MRSNAGRVCVVGARLARRVGDAPVDRLRRAGELGADLAHAVAQADDVVEALRRRTRSRCLERRPARSMPRSRITRTAFGCSGLGWLPALHARTAPSGQLLGQRLGHLRARAVAGAQEQHARRPGRAAARPRGATAERQAGVQRGAGAGEQLAAARQVERRSRCRGRRRGCGAPRPARRRAAGAGGRRRGSGARRQLAQLADAPVAARQRAQQPPAQRMARQLQKPRRRAPRPVATLTPADNTSMQFDVSAAPRAHGYRPRSGVVASLRCRAIPGCTARPGIPILSPWTASSSASGGAAGGSRRDLRRRARGDRGRTVRSAALRGRLRRGVRPVHGRHARGGARAPAPQPAT